MSENGEIYTAGKKFYTDGMDKFHLWAQLCTRADVAIVEEA